MDLGGELGSIAGSDKIGKTVGGEVPQAIRPSSAASVAGLNAVAPEPARDGAPEIAYEKEAVDAEIQDYSITSSLSFFLKHSYRDVGRRRFHFCLSFCSVFVVVWSALVINTLVEKGPIVFLKLAEGIQGQYDGIVYPVLSNGGFDDDLESYHNSEGVFINYTKVEDVTKSKFNLAPRKQFCDSHVGTNYPAAIADMDKEELSDYSSDFIRAGKTKLPPIDKYKNNEKKDRLFPHAECLMLMDTEKERTINLGSRYTFPPLDEGECFINEDQAMIMKVKEGDYIYHSLNMYQNLVGLIDAYNTKVAGPERIPQIPRDIVQAGNESSVVEFPCKVAIIGNQTYGKFPLAGVEDQVMMEYKHFLPLIARYLPAPLASKNEFKEFLLTNGTSTIFELSDFLMMTLPQPRVNYYQSTNYYNIQTGVTGYANEVIDALGFYPVRISLDVLKVMEISSQAILFLGLIFDMIILLFIIRMQGLSKTGLIYMIFL
jgi:hypothetical protein